MISLIVPRWNYIVRVVHLHMRYTVGVYFFDDCLTTSTVSSRNMTWVCLVISSMAFFILLYGSSFPGRASKFRTANEMTSCNAAKSVGSH